MAGSFSRPWSKDGGCWSGSSPSSTNRPRCSTISRASVRPCSVGSVRRRAGMAEVVQRLLEEDLRRGVPLLIAPLAVEGMHEDPPSSAPAVVAHLGQPVGHHPRLARSAFGVEHEDAHDALVPGPIERRQLLLAAGEAVTVGAQDFQSVGQGGGGGRWKHRRFGTVRFELGNVLHYKGSKGVRHNPGCQHASYTHLGSFRLPLEHRKPRPERAKI